MAGRRRTFGRSKPIHPTHWCAPATGSLDFTVGGTTTQTELCSAGMFSAFSSPTIVRIRGELVIGIDADITTEESGMVHLGIIVVDDDQTWTDSLAVQAGLERQWLWLYSSNFGTYKSHYPMFNSSGTFVATREVFRNFFHHVHLDVKAMRRVPLGSKLIMVGSVENFVGTGDAIIRGVVRTLIKE